MDSNTNKGLGAFLILILTKSLKGTKVGWVKNKTSAYIGILKLFTSTWASPIIIISFTSKSISTFA